VTIAGIDISKQRGWERINRIRAMVFAIPIRVLNEATRLHIATHLNALTEYVNSLEAANYRLARDLGQRLQQLGFTRSCSSHGEDYSATCGACRVAKDVAWYEDTK
jgi:hypothetical protein